MSAVGQKDPCGGIIRKVKSISRLEFPPRCRCPSGWKFQCRCPSRWKFQCRCPFRAGHFLHGSSLPCPFRAGREEADIRASHPSDTSVGHASLEKVSMTSKWSCSSCEKGGTGQKGRTACSISTLAVKPVAVYQPSYLIVPPLPPVHQSHFQ